MLVRTELFHLKHTMGFMHNTVTFVYSDYKLITCSKTLLLKMMQVVILLNADWYKGDIDNMSIYIELTDQLSTKL